MSLSTPDAPVAHLLDAVSVGLSIYRLESADDPATLRLVYANAASGTILGLDSDAEIGRRIGEIAPGAFGTDLPEVYADIARGGSSRDLGIFEYSDARIRRTVVSLSAHPLPDRCVGIVFEDVSDRAELNALRGAQKAIARSEIRYRSLVEATAAIVWRTPASGEFVSDQPRWSAFTGQTTDELMGHGWLDAVHPDDRAETEAAWAEAVDSRSPYTIAHRLRHADGYRHMVGRAVPVLDASGEIEEWIGVHSDVDAQVGATAALSESEARFRSLFDALTDVVLVYPTASGAPGSFVAFNRAAERVYGYSPEELASLTMDDIVAPGGPSIPEAMAQLRREGRSTFESVHLSKEGRRLQMSTSARLIEYDGQTCVLAVCRDDTERRSFQRELARTNLRLERTVEERTREAEAFADDLRILHRIMTAEHESMQARFEAYLGAGCEMFDLPVGILASTPEAPEIGERLYHTEAVVSPDPSIAADMTVPLSEAFCDAVVETQATVAYADAAKDAPEHPACVQRSLRAYIGAPILVDGEWFGTVNFVSPEPRKGGFRRAEVDLIELMATAIGRQIALGRLSATRAKELAWYRTVVQTVDDAVLHLGPDGEVVSHTDSASDLLDTSGALRTDRVGRSGEPLAPEALPERIALREGRPVHVGLHGVGSGADRRWYTVDIAPVDEDADGVADGAVAVFHDVTAAQAVTARAERTRDLLRSVLAASPEGVMAFRAVRSASGEIDDFEWLLVNARAEGIVHRSAADLIGQRLLEVFPGNREAGLFDAYVGVVEGRGVYETTIPYAHDGLETSFRLTAVPLPSEDGFTVTFVEILEAQPAS